MCNILFLESKAQIWRFCTGCLNPKNIGRCPHVPIGMPDSEGTCPNNVFALSCFRGTVVIRHPEAIMDNITSPVVNTAYMLKWMAGLCDDILYVSAGREFAIRFQTV